MNGELLRDVLIKKDLTNREVEIANLTAHGLSNKEIGNQLFITENTVKAHLLKVYQKLKLGSRAQLIVFCLPHLRFKE